MWVQKVVLYHTGRGRKSERGRDKATEQMPNRLLQGSLQNYCKYPTHADTFLGLKWEMHPRVEES